MAETVVPEEGALHAPATLRNREPILEVVKGALNPGTRILEIASGSGEHAVYLAPRLQCPWQPSDPAPAACQSVSTWIRTTGVEAWVAPPVRLDAEESPWPVEPPEAVVCMNMIHIAPVEALQGLMRGSGALLPPDGVLVLYGPFKDGENHTSPSNAAFDASLRARNPRWGIRSHESVVACARDANLALTSTVEMPANNRTLMFKKASPCRS